MKKLKIKLQEIDLKKGDSKNHPDINCRNLYLCRINSCFYVGKFSRQWYGLNFKNWGMSGLQYDKPGTNCSDWQQVWKIIK